MINKCILTSRTEEGKKAITQHWEESKGRKTALQMATFKAMGFRQELKSDENKNIILEIEIKNKNIQALINQKHFIQEIEDTMKQNGAVMHIDYIIEVV